MPCYCYIPDENDQVEIQRRAKTTMYFDAIELFGQDLDVSSIRPYLDINTALCKVCKKLTDEQQKKIPANLYYKIKWPYETLYDWYQQHLIDDKKNRNLK